MEVDAVEMADLTNESTAAWVQHSEPKEGTLHSGLTATKTVQQEEETATTTTTTIKGLFVDVNAIGETSSISDHQI